MLLKALVYTRRASALLPIVERVECWERLTMKRFLKLKGAPHTTYVYRDLHAMARMSGDGHLEDQLPSPSEENRWSVAGVGNPDS